METVSESCLRAIEAQMGPARLPACTFAVTRADGASWAGALGTADLREGRPATEDTTFHLFSGTKLYTAAAVLLLSDRGLVALDTPISEYLADLQLKHPITVRHLCSHSSGLKDTLKAFLSAHRAGTPAPTTREALDRYQLRSAKPPGGTAAYRNVNFALLGELITTVSGVPYETFIRDELLAPLGATLGFTYEASLGSEVATGYVDRWNPMRGLIRLIVPGLLQNLEDHIVDGRVGLCDFSIDTAAIGGLIGSAPEFLPFLREFVSSDDGVLRAESRRAMLTMQAEGSAGIASTVGVGLGWKLGRAGSVTFWNHEGGGPGFVSETRLYPDQGLGMVVLSNTMQSAKRSWVAHAICELLRAECAG